MATIEAIPMAPIAPPHDTSTTCTTTSPTFLQKARRVWRNMIGHLTAEQFSFLPLYEAGATPDTTLAFLTRGEVSMDALLAAAVADKDANEGADTHAATPMPLAPRPATASSLSPPTLKYDLRYYPKTRIAYLRYDDKEVGSLSPMHEYIYGGYRLAPLTSNQEVDADERMTKQTTVQEKALSFLSPLLMERDFTFPTIKSYMIGLPYQFQADTSCHATATDQHQRSSAGASEDEAARMMPMPTNRNVRVVDLPGQAYAVLPCAHGFMDERRLVFYTGLLRSALVRDGQPVDPNPNHTLYASYHPPWTLPWHRRHEVWIPLRPKERAASPRTPDPAMATSGSADAQGVFDGQLKVPGSCGNTPLLRSDSPLRLTDLYARLDAAPMQDRFQVPTKATAFSMSSLSAWFMATVGGGADGKGDDVLRPCHHYNEGNETMEVLSHCLHGSPIH